MRRQAAPNRRAWGVAAALVLFGLIVVLVARRDERRIDSGAPEPPPFIETEVDSGITDLELSRGVRLRFPPPAEPEPEPPPAPPPAIPELVGPPAPPPEELEIAATPSLPESSAASDSSAAELAANVTPEPAPPSTTSEPTPLRPRTIVHPRVPEKVIAKRKIDDAVLLQSLVGPDGRVLEVRVLQSIPRCDECTQSAIEAAERFIYEAPGGDREVWTTPFEIRFTYRR